MDKNKTLGELHREEIAMIFNLLIENEKLIGALDTAADMLHAFVPAGTPAVDAFIKKWRK